jgi:tetraacyldisaccharide 4'-kinase
LLSYLYGEFARRRRGWYARHPEARRALARPVVSVGNLVVGGSGKTPLVAHLARLLREAGERPSILTRGYGRTAPVDGVVVVHDGERLRADLGRSGDEPLMLARSVGAAVLVSPDRYLAGRLAEARLGCTVHLLDDGFQHLALARDVDLLIVDREDLEERLLPFGRLREPIDAARHADALLVANGEGGHAFGAAVRTFDLVRRPGAIRCIGAAAIAPGDPVVLVAAVARPDRFRAEADAAGWAVREALVFRDHHRFTARDVARMADRVRAAGARAVLTTEKDVMRLLPFRPLPFPLAWAPLEVTAAPAEAFRAWLLDRIRLARSRGAGKA